MRFNTCLPNYAWFIVNKKPLQNQCSVRWNCKHGSYPCELYTENAKYAQNSYWLFGLMFKMKSRICDSKRSAGWSTYQSSHYCGWCWTLPSVYPSPPAAGSGTAPWLEWTSRRCPLETAWRCCRTGTSSPSCAGSGYLCARRSVNNECVPRAPDLKTSKSIKNLFHLMSRGNLSDPIQVIWFVGAALVYAMWQKSNQGIY